MKPDLEKAEKDFFSGNLHRIFLRRKGNWKSEEKVLHNRFTTLILFLLLFDLLGSQKRTLSTEKTTANV